MKPNYLFKILSERDMDMLFMEEFASSKDFCKIFLSKLGLQSDFSLVSIEHSKDEIGLGESDLTVIFEINGERHALLVEDKIDAQAMPAQALRYTKRGNKGIADGNYEFFDVFIVAPQHYLDTNEEAKKYPISVSYEEVLHYFQRIDDKRAQFKIQQINQALYKEKSGYVLEENKNITDFWSNYIAYQKEFYPDVPIKTADRARGSKSHWIDFKSPIPGIQIVYKTDQGFVDIQIRAPRSFDMEIRNLVEAHYPKSINKEIFPQRKKSSKNDGLASNYTVGVKTISIDKMRSFSDLRTDIDDSFVAVRKALEIIEKLELHRFIK